MTKASLIVGGAEVGEDIKRIFETCVGMTYRWRGGHQRSSGIAQQS